MSDLPIVAEVTPLPDVVVDVTPLPAIEAEVGALYGPRTPTTPEDATVYEYAPTAWAIDVTNITEGRTYIASDGIAADGTTFMAVIATPGTAAGSFRVVVRPQTETIALTGGFLIITSAGNVAYELVGDPLPTTLTDGAVFECYNGGDGWTVTSSPLDFASTGVGTELADNLDYTQFSFSTGVSNLRSHMYVGVAHDGAGVTDYIDQTRVGDDAGYYMAADNAEPVLPAGTFPTGGPAMIALRNQASADGEGVTGFYHARRMPASLTFTISTPLGNITVTPANYASPQPVEGDVCLVNGLTVDGQWQDSNIQEGEDVAVGDTLTWRTTGTGMFTDFVDISPGGAVTAADVSYDGTTSGSPATNVQDAVDSAFQGVALLGTPPVDALTPTTGSVDLDLDAVNGFLLTHALSGNVTYTSSNRAAGKSATVKVLCDATPRTFTFPSWEFMGTAPTGIAASTTGTLTVTWYGTADTDAVAVWEVEGSGGSGDVAGPASATADSLARFDGTTGKLLKDGAVIGTDVQAYDADLATIAGLTATSDNFIQSKSSAWASRTPAQVAADLIPQLYGSFTLPVLGGASASAGTWTAQTTGNMTCLGSAGAINDYREWAYVPAGGTYTITLMHMAGAALGQYQLSINGSTTSLSLIEGYAASNTATQSTIATGYVLAAGLHTIRISVPSKNAASSNYVMRMASIDFVRTA